MKNPIAREDNFERFEHLKNVLGWRCDLDGRVYGAYGQRIGYKDTNGYLKSTQEWGGETIKVSLHQFVYFYFHGRTAEIIDHVDNVRTNNRIENLREVTPSQNNFNRSDVRGYRYRARDKKFHAQICVNGISYNLGRYDTEYEARVAYLEAKKKYHVID
jgi:hypothetical protein